MNWLTQHPYLFTTTATWVFNIIITAFVGSFPAPTKDSTVFYQWWFVFSNTVMGNIKRAQSTHVENSPNFEDAVNIRINGAATAQMKQQVEQGKVDPKV